MEVNKFFNLCWGVWENEILIVGIEKEFWRKKDIMDCCNYVQPYPAHGHFYQQHHFCYDNMSPYGAGAYGSLNGGGGGGAPGSDAIEANAARYNRLSPAYPTGIYDIRWVFLQSFFFAIKKIEKILQASRLI